MGNKKWLELSFGRWGLFTFIEIFMWVYLFRTYHHRGWCCWLIKKMGRVEQSVWNSFHVLSNVLCFTYVETLENFLYNLSSIILSSICMAVKINSSMKDSLHHITWLSTDVYVVVLRWLGTGMVELWTTTQGWVILVLSSWVKASTDSSGSSPQMSRRWRVTKEWKLLSLNRQAC